MILRCVALLLLVLFVQGASAQPPAEYRPSFAPGQLRGSAAARPNEVMVLGTPHLASLPERFRPEMAAPLIDRLAAWRPTAIAIEALSGMQCDALRRYPSRYASTVEDYCFDPSEAGRAVGLDVPTANAEVERMLAAWPQDPAPAARRRLAALFLAAGEPTSALVQWLRLPSSERRAENGLNDTLIALLERRRLGRNENNVIGAVLAARLGLERVWSVDDHTADSMPFDPEAHAAAMRSAWNNPDAQARRDADEPLIAGLGQPDGLLNLYRNYNDPETVARVFRGDFGAALAEPSPGQYGRRYVGWWETRNLRMVANIREVLMREPGTRMLAIVGASHKGYYEAYVDQMHDVRLIDTATFLR